MTIKVLHIGKYFPPFFGGIESFMAELMPALQRLEIAPLALVHRHHPGFFYRDQSVSFALYRASCFGSLFFAPLSPWFGLDLHKVIKQQQPDVLHLHLPNTSVFWALLLPSARRLPWVVHWHADVLGDKPRLAIRLLYPLYRFFERIILRKAGAIVCTSPSYLESSQPLQAYRNKCKVIPLGLADLEPELAAIKPVANSDADKLASRILKVLVVGRFSYYKGHRFLLDALALLPEGCAVELVLVGKGELESELKQQVTRLNLSQVTFAGSVSSEQLRNWYNWCDCLCLPSIERTEAFGMVIIEAARQKKPALVTAVPGSGMAWVVQDNKTGWVVPPADTAALANILLKLSQQPELIEKAGEQAYSRFNKTFSINQVAVQVANLYHRLLQKSA